MQTRRVIFLKLKTVPNYSTLDTLVTEDKYSTTCSVSKTESKEEQVNFNSFSYAWPSAMLFVEPQVSFPAGAASWNPSVTPSDLYCLPLAPSSFYDLESLFIHSRRQIFLWNKASGVVIYKEPLFGAALSSCVVAVRRQCTCSLSALSFFRRILGRLVSADTKQVFCECVSYLQTAIELKSQLVMDMRHCRRQYS